MTCILGINRMQLDFEFIVGRRLTKMWYVLWWFAPLVLFAFFIWALATIPANGMVDEDPAWMYGIGFGIIFIAFIFILAVGFYTVYKQEEYLTIADVSTIIKNEMKIVLQSHDHGNYAVIHI